MNKIHFRWLLLSLPPIAGFILFFLAPYLFSAFYSVIKSPFDWHFVGFTHYQEVLTSRSFLKGSSNTITLLLLSLPPIMALSLLLAELTAHNPFMQKTLLPLLMLPMFLPSVAIVDVFSLLDVSPPMLVVMMYMWKYTGFITLIVAASRIAISSAVYEASQIDGANDWQQFCLITLPLLSGTLVFALLMGISLQLRIFRESYLLYGAYPDDRIYTLLHYMNNQFHKLQYPIITSSSNLFFGVLCLAMGCGFIVLRWLQRRLRG